MKELFESYKCEFCAFLKNKKIVVFIILTVILSYGFYITNISIGIDDLSLDRYVSDTYILSQGRWGTFIIYNLLRITEFAPLWLDFITILVLFFTSIVCITFLKRISNSKIKNSSYIIFVTAFISCPVISYFFVYQPTKLTVALSNLLAIVIGIIIYENFMKNLNEKIRFKNIRFVLVLALILTFANSMYESCAQTFVVFVFAITFLHIVFSENNLDLKQIFKYWFYSFLCLLFSVILYELIKILLVFILDKLNLLKVNGASDTSLFYVLEDCMNLSVIKNVLLNKVENLFSNKLTIYFLCICLIGLIFAVKETIKRKNKSLILIYIFMVLSNFLLIFYLKDNLYRVCYSWVLTIALFLVFANELLYSKKSIIITAVIGYVILMQTQVINKIFYKEYLAYENSCNYLNYVMGLVLEIDESLEKPILFIDEDLFSQMETVSEIKFNYLEWGISAFEEHGVEMKKFLENMGYNINIVDYYEECIEIFEETISEENKEVVIDFEDFIAVRIDI